MAERIERVCVFGGSNPGARPVYAEAARTLGRTLAERGMGLVYGGARVGLMGAVADTVLAAGGEAIGVIPHALVAREVAHSGLTELHVVNSMHERKALMADLAGAFIALPGGYGTLDALCEILTWSQLGLHPKPVGLLNVEGYFDPLLALFDRAAEDGFIPAPHRGLALADTDAARLLDRFAAYEPPSTGTWISEEER
jgi:uncharacterized protein (TIGR00730 family)